MKKLIFVGILGLFVLGSCNNSTVTHTHDEHDHAAEGHNHEAEGPDHSHEGEYSGEHNHEAADEYNEAAEAHSDEIILPKAKAEAAGVKVSVIEPAPFQQVIKTSGQVLAAQGDESVAVATVAIGVSNIMMVTVKERTTEIGIRRAIGARPKDILQQILSESMVLTTIAGMCGISFAVMVLQLVEMGANADGGDTRFQVTFGLAIGTCALLIALGMLAGLAPAYRAMAIKPIEAIRDE